MQSITFRFLRHGALLGSDAREEHTVGRYWNGLRPTDAANVRRDLLSNTEGTISDSPQRPGPENAPSFVR